MKNLTSSCIDIKTTKKLMVEIEPNVSILLKVI